MSDRHLDGITYQQLLSVLDNRILTVEQIVQVKEQIVANLRSIHIDNVTDKQAEQLNRVLGA